ncbi:MAG TPA: tetratricopeptide repeat protein [Methanocorpusculum sp.]|nr:tetratricopeptide repeat protein [Methanocorpusculum sp.]
MGGIFSRGDKQNPWIARGEAAAEKQQFDDACAHYIRAAELEPQNSQILMRLASLQKYIGKYADAQATYAKAAAAAPENTEAWIQSALLLGDAGNYAGALQSIEKASLPEDNLYLKDKKCDWLCRIGKYKEAADAAKELSLKQPENEHYKARYAENLMRSGQYTAAVNIYNELMQAFPKNASKYAKDAAFCAEAAGDNDTAAAYYSRISDDDTLGLYRRARLEEAAGKFADAAASYGKVLGKEGKDELHLSLRRIFTLFWGGNNKQAAAELEKLIAAHDSSADLWYLLGTLSFMTGSLKRAAECFKEVIHRGAGSMPAVWGMKGASEFFSGQYKEAYESFRRAELVKSGKAAGSDFFEGEDMELLEVKEPVTEISFTKENPELSAIEACCLAALGHFEEADKAALTALSLDSSRVDMEILHLRLLSSAGRYQAAEEAFAAVEEIVPDDYAILFEHAENDMLLGNFTRAAGTLRNLLAEYPENTMLSAKLLECITASGNVSEAKDTAAELISAMPENAAMFRAAADAAYAAGEYANAADHYARSAELQPEIAAGYEGLGKSEMMLGRYTAAKEAFLNAAAYMEENLGMVFLQAKCAAEAGEFEEAAALYKTILQSYPEACGAAGELALISTILGKHEETEAAVSAAAAQNEADFLLYKLGGDACMCLSRYDEAVSYYLDALGLRNDDAKAHASLGFAYAAKGAYSDALASFESSLAADPDDTKVIAGKAACEENLGKLSDAENTLRGLTEKDPENLPGLLQLADVLERQQKYDEMVDVYSRYLELQPENVDVFRKVAAVYAMRGETEEALSGYEMILEACPEDKITLRRKAEALAALGRWKEAAETCSAVLEFDEADASVRLLYAKSLANAGLTEEAAEQYTVILKADRTNTGALFDYGDLLSRIGNYKKALIAFERVIQANPDNQLAHAENVSAAVKIGDPKTGITALKNAASAASDNPYLLAGIGYMAAASGKPSEALTFFDKAEAAGCTDADINNSRAFIYLAQSRYDLALPAASDAAEKHPENAVAWRLKAKALEGLGEFEEAVECYKMSLNPAAAKEDAEFSDDRLAEEATEDAKHPAGKDDDSDCFGGLKSAGPSHKERITTSPQKDKITPSSAHDAAANRRKAFGDADSFGGDSGREKKQRGLIIN